MRLNNGHIVRAYNARLVTLERRIGAQDWYSVCCITMAKNNQSTKRTDIIDVSESQKEAGKYVGSIMGSQYVSVSSTVAEASFESMTPLCRKRNLSAPSYSDSDVKKAKNGPQVDGASDSDSESDQDSSTDRIMTNARRSLYGRTPASERNTDKAKVVQKDSRSKVTVMSDNISTIMQSLQSISSEIKAANTTLGERITTEVRKVNDTVTKRIAKLEADLDKRLSDRLAQLADKRVNTEV